MPSFISPAFDNLLEIALGKTQDVTNVTYKDIPEIIQEDHRADPAKRQCRPGSREFGHGRSSQEPEPYSETLETWEGSPGTPRHAKLRGDKGRWSRGVYIYMCKLTPFQDASKLHSTMTTELPWFYIDGIETFREYMVTLGHYHLHKYRMTSTHSEAAIFTQRQSLSLRSMPSWPPWTLQTRSWAGNQLSRHTI